MRPLYRIGEWLSRRLPPPAARRIGARYWRDMHRLGDADVAFVSFPKSGRTFVRVMLAHLYEKQFGIDERELLRFDTLLRAPAEVPRILFTHNGNAMRPPERIGIDREAFAGKRVVLLARHPGDVAVSRYFHLKHRSRDRLRQQAASRPLDDFVWSRRGGVPSIVRFLNLWADLSRQRGDMFIVRYEDFLGRPHETLRELGEFVGLARSDDWIAETVEFARFENLKKKERDGYFSAGRMKPGREGGEASFKVRSGIAGGFRAKLSEPCAAKVEAYVREHLDPVFGYGDVPDGRDG